MNSTPRHHQQGMVGVGQVLVLLGVAGDEVVVPLLLQLGHREGGQWWALGLAGSAVGLLDDTGFERRDVQGLGQLVGGFRVVTGGSPFR
jgi:hypothetical protein